MYKRQRLFFQHLILNLPHRTLLYLNTSQIFPDKNPRLLSSAGIIASTYHILYTLFHSHLNPGGSARVYKKGAGFFLHAIIYNLLPGAQGAYNGILSLKSNCLRVRGILHDVRAVSYTHLDVYKRQF